VRKNWQARYFVLTPLALAYYESAPRSGASSNPAQNPALQLKGTIPLCA
jgi:hypothetical protein